ncbi:MFS transporter [Desulfohalobium retbaense]|uniref:Major facilitator superfamily MFS_1 n=1 Tax=Desulfohalobium retbaense (strain ATCC 49708 / DSM 5692 / JCM 16813 / HR100) TaxID=485915 RepID=C8X0A2_DESRD|nr:MFS transporter [Desulfohalobium retbaense]ACV67727.1 major facilitator superfamily MFS_1 [Desulfohalobium retbaense DSM 5692]
MSFRRSPMYLFLLVLTVSVWAGFQGWRTLLNNFAVEVAHLGGHHMGVIQSVREVPGFLALLVIYILLIVKEHRLAAVSVLILGLGVVLTGFFPSFWGVLLATLLMSFGFHYFETVNQSLTLQYFSVGDAPLVFGRLRAIGAATSIGVGLSIFALANWLPYKLLFALLGCISIAGAMWCLFQDPTDTNMPSQNKHMVLRRRYWLFYTLTLLAGARRQIFIAFAVFLLVEKFGLSVQEITLLFVANQALNYFVSPLVGRAINHFGERSVLSVEYASLIVVFLVYALSDSQWLVLAMYIVDHVVFNCAMAIRTFFQKIGDPGDIAPSMAVGFTINHIAAVLIPAAAGLIWLVDPAWVFLGGVGLSLCSLLLVQAIPWQLKRSRTASSG